LAGLNGSGKPELKPKTTAMLPLIFGSLPQETADLNTHRCVEVSDVM